MFTFLGYMYTSIPVADPGFYLRGGGVDFVNGGGGVGVENS